MKIAMIKDKVLVAENKMETTTESGIVLTGFNAKKETKTGTVIGVGPDVTDVKFGDVVLIDWEKGTIVKVDDAYRIVIAQEHIQAVLEGYDQAK